MAKILLHGTLHVTIFGARGIVTPQKKHHPVRRFLTSVSFIGRFSFDWQCVSLQLIYR